MTKPVEPWFHVGQRILCIDSSPNRRRRLTPLKRGKIYVVRAIVLAPGWTPARPEWAPPGFGVHLEELFIFHPANWRPWPLDPNRFRPVIERPTNIEVFKKMLLPKQLRLPFEEK